METTLLMHGLVFAHVSPTGGLGRKCRVSTLGPDALGDYTNECEMCCHACRLLSHLDTPEVDARPECGCPDSFPCPDSSTCPVISTCPASPTRPANSTCPASSTHPTDSASSICPVISTCPANSMCPSNSTRPANSLCPANSTRPASSTRPDSIAYVLCTSGTTGVPRLVQVPHCSIVPNILDLRGRFSMVPDDVMFNAAPLTFDPSFVEARLRTSLVPRPSFI